MNLNIIRMTDRELRAMRERLKRYMMKGLKINGISRCEQCKTKYKTYQQLKDHAREVHQEGLPATEGVYIRTILAPKSHRNIIRKTNPMTREGERWAASEPPIFDSTIPVGRYTAMDKSGTWIAYDTKPNIRKGRDYWLGEHPDVIYTENKFYGFWKESLFQMTENGLIHIESKPLMKTYITFGQDHRHVVNDVIYDKDCIAVLESENAATSRALAFEIFGDKFCFEYPEEFFDERDLHHFPRGLISAHPESNT